jgi:pimeloyl-ACP methyl ester carboxylesterase
MDKRGKALRRGLVAASAIVILLGAGAVIAFPYFLPSAIAYAPNAGRSIDPRQDDEFLPAGNFLHLRVPVGPPAASISCLVRSPSRGAEVRGTILVLHGVRDDKRSQLGTAVFLSDLGYRAVLVDSRGHGRSTGEHLTYGVQESRDMLQVLDHLRDKGLLLEPLGAVGFSYGGAVALQLAARDERVKAVVTVSTFSSLREVVKDYVMHYAPFPGLLLTDAQLDRALKKAGEIARFDPAEADNMKAASMMGARLLIIHGQEDPKVPVSHAYRIHEAAGDKSELIVVPGEGHDSLIADRTGMIRKKMKAWFDRWL